MSFDNREIFIINPEMLQSEEPPYTIIFRDYKAQAIPFSIGPDYQVYFGPEKEIQRHLCPENDLQNGHDRKWVRK